MTDKAAPHRAALSSLESFLPGSTSRQVDTEGKAGLNAKLYRWWPFILLLVVAASRWVVADAHPEAAPSLVSAAVGCGWAALLTFTFTRRAAASKSTGFRSLIAGALFLGGPAIGLLLGVRYLNAGALTMALALTPVAVAIGVTALGAATSQGVAGRIWPGLAAVTGLLLILVQPNLSNTASDIALFLAPTLTGLGAALFETSDPSNRKIGASAANALMGASGLFTFATLVLWVLANHRPTFSLLAVAYEGVLALLSVLALSRLGATRWSSQFTWLPLLILLEGITLVRPPVTARWVIGLMLLMLASVYLLLPQADDPEVAQTIF